MPITPFIKSTRYFYHFAGFLMSLGIIMQSTPATAVQIWATGVTQDGGWTDTVGSAEGHCWAATATNLILHWQNELTKTYELPVNAPKTEEDIRAYFVNNFDPAYQVKSGIKWYMQEYFPMLQLPMPAPLPDSNPIATEWCNHDSLAEFSSRIKRVLSYGEPIGLDLFTIKHANTLWGAQFNDTTNLLEKVWITDSGRNSNGLEEWCVREIPEADREDYQGFSFQFGKDNGNGSQSWLYVVDFMDYLTTDIKDVNGNTPDSLITPSIPEPTSVMLACAGIVLSLRRRHQ